MRNRIIALVAVLIALVGLFPAPAAQAQTATASDLRARLGYLLSEHVALAASATGGALGGRAPQFQAAAAALDANSVDISKAIGSVYGADAETAFLALWRSHIDIVVRYTTALGNNDQAAADAAAADLLAYADTLATFLNGANPNLPVAAVSDLVKMHLTSLKDVIDAQKAGDAKAQFTAIRAAYGHMDMIASGLAGGIAAQFPDKFTGKADDGAANLRAGLNTLFGEHVYLAARATSGALGGRQAEFEAAAAALDANSVDISKAVGSVYGADAESAFLPLWRSHIDIVVRYTTALGNNDQAAADAAAADLLAYADTLANFLSGANPNLPAATVSDLVEMHLTTLKTVIDAQKAGDQTAVYTELRSAMGHMGMIADPLAAAIVAQFPEKFGGAAQPAPAATAMPMPMPAGGQPATPATLPNTGAAEDGMALMLGAALLLLVVGGLALMRMRRSA